MATLAAQFFFDWVFIRVKWFTNYTLVRFGQRAAARVLRLQRQLADRALPAVPDLRAVFALLAKNLVRGNIGRQWMAIRDMDIAAEMIGIRPLYAKLTAFAVSSFMIGVAGALWAFVYLGSWEPLAFNIDRSFQILFMVIIGGLGSILGAFWVRPSSSCCRSCSIRCRCARHAGVGGDRIAAGVHGHRRPDLLAPDRRTARARPTVVDRQGEAEALALPPLSA